MWQKSTHTVESANHSLTRGTLSVLGKAYSKPCVLWCVHVSKSTEHRKAAVVSKQVHTNLVRNELKIQVRIHVLRLGQGALPQGAPLCCALGSLLDETGFMMS